MREAIITCTCPSIRIPDLGLTLSKGNVVHLDAAKAESSKDLAVAKQAFGVKVEYIGRCRTQRAGPRNLPPPAPQPRPEPEKPPQKEEIDLDALAEKVAAKMGRDVSAIRKLLKGDMRELLMETLSGLMLASGEGTQTGISGRVAPGQAEEPMPMFIPDGLVGEERADIAVQEGQDEGSSVDEATAILRRMRKKRKP